MPLGEFSFRGMYLCTYVCVYFTTEAADPVITRPPSHIRGGGGAVAIASEVGITLIYPTSETLEAEVG